MLYSLSKDNKLVNTSVIISVQSVVAVIISVGAIKCCQNSSLVEDINGTDVRIGVYNTMTMYCSNSCVQYVDFPLMLLAKSAKIIPVMMGGWLRGVYKLTTEQVAIALTISSGLVIFNSAKMGGLTLS